MQTNRRTALKHFLLLSAGIVVIPSCLRQKGKPSIVLNNLDISLDDETLLAGVCETLIPDTGTPGAKATGLHLFVMKMVDDCVSKDDQQQFLEGMRAFEEMAVASAGEPFTRCTERQCQDLLGKIERRKNIPPGLSFFYDMVKKYTVQGYTTSQYFLTNIQVYELVPGRFHGCVPIDRNRIQKS